MDFGGRFPKYTPQKGGTESQAYGAGVLLAHMRGEGRRFAVGRRTKSPPT